MKPKVTVACPHCGQSQLEARDAYSTVCRHCRQHFRVQEALRPSTPKTPEMPQQKQVVCFHCGTLLPVSLEAQSTMCKRCSTHVDLRDYQIDQAVSKNFRTHGSFVIGEKGYVFNTEADVGDAVIKGRFLGKLRVHRSLTLFSTAEIRGTFKTRQLIIPAGHRFTWKDPIALGSAEVAGELVASLHASEYVRINGTGRLFGNVQAHHLVVEAGAVLVGAIQVGESVNAPEEQKRGK